VIAVLLFVADQYRERLLRLAEHELTNVALTAMGRSIWEAARDWDAAWLGEWRNLMLLLVAPPKCVHRDWCSLPLGHDGDCLP
jgi:hypothetical protein